MLPDMKNLIPVRDQGDYRVNLTTGEAWVVKTQRQSGTTYMSSITSARKLKRLQKLAMEQVGGDVPLLSVLLPRV